VPARRKGEETASIIAITNHDVEKAVLKTMAFRLRREVKSGALSVDKSTSDSGSSITSASADNFWRSSSLDALYCIVVRRSARASLSQPARALFARDTSFVRQ
jgi:hypothetical protein